MTILKIGTGEPKESNLPFLLRNRGKRWHLMEIHDQWWCPRIIRTSLQKILAESWGIEDGFLVSKSIARCAAPVIAKTLRETGTDEILDMCSGGGGPYETICRVQELKEPLRKVTLTDLYPNVASYEVLAKMFPGRLTYSSTPVNATAWECQDKSKRYLRTMMLSQHHFKPEMLQLILQDCVRNDHGFLAVELGNRSIFALTTAVLGGMFASQFVTLIMLRKLPFNLETVQRLAVTFCLPILPVCFALDGLVSFLRVYSRNEFLEVARKADPEGKYKWEVIEEYVPGIFVPMTIYRGVPPPKKSQQ